MARMLLMTTLIVSVAGIVGIIGTPPIIGLADLESAIESKGCLIYQTYPSQVDCAVSIASHGLLKV